tara:strand:- start:44405 stop:45271 length:867 start_codon:yes stop_codon:yes gene_type:complete
MRSAWLAALAVVGACNATTPAPPEPLHTPAPGQTSRPNVEPNVAAAVVPDAMQAAPSPIPTATTQLIVSRSDDWEATATVLQRYRRKAGATWQPVGPPIASTLGRTGLGWGRGLHTVPEGDDPIKREGDGRSPAGVFRITNSYGYDKAPTGTNLPFQEVSRSWRCVNDAESEHYNKVLDSKQTTVDWSEAEKMRRNDHLYELVIEVDHNHIQRDVGVPTPGDGSCIFLHVWRRPGAPTIGCTAMPLEDMHALLSWLDPKAVPVLVALPNSRYEAVRVDWNLPDISVTP